MADEQGDASEASQNTKSGASSTPADDQHAGAPDPASERESLWEASPLSPADSVAEANLSPGVRAALEQIFGAGEQRLRRVAERSAVYDVGATNDAGEGIEALASRYDMSLGALVRAPESLSRGPSRAMLRLPTGAAGRGRQSPACANGRSGAGVLRRR